MFSLGFLHCGHSRRDRRWAKMPPMFVARMSGKTPMSVRREMVAMALLVCTVVKTKWPVMAARKTNSAVSLSRTSPTRMMSGSCRSMDFTPAAQSILEDSLTADWRIIGNGYSTGSSSVMMFTPSRFRCWMTE